MPLRQLHQAVGLVHQISGSPDGIPVVYLPGVHGCWTPLYQARPLLERKVRLIEIAYPPFESWTLVDYAQSLFDVLDAIGIESAHLIGESFGSLVGWQAGQLYPERIRSHMLVGGLCRGPKGHRAALARLGLLMMPSFVFNFGIDIYVAYKNARGETRSQTHVRAYPAVRDRPGQRATANRMQLIKHADFRDVLAQIEYPVRYLGGEHDNVISVQREIDTLTQRLSHHASFKSNLIPRAPHAIIASHPHQTVDYLTDWVAELEV